MTHPLHDKVAVVTGAGSGLGAATARALAAAGCKVACLDVNRPGIDSVATELGGNGGALPIGCDVADADAVSAAVCRVDERWGRLDVLVNCAAVDHTVSVDEMTIPQWDQVVGVNLRGVDQARKRLRAFAGAATTDADKRAASAVIQEFDNHIEQAVTKGLFEGDEKFLSALKDARSEYSAYQRNFRKQNSFDDSGRVLETMVRQDVTPEQVANYIYGSSKVGANATSVRTVQRLKQLLGTDSAEWAAIRQGAWQKLTGTAEGKTPLGPQAVASRIAEFTSGDGKTFAQQLFSPEEISAMQKHARIEQALSAKSGTVNLPNSGNRLAGLLRESFGTIGGMLGMSAGGPQGAAAGYAAGKAAGGVGDFVNAAQTRALYRGQKPISIGQRLTSVSASSARRLAPPTTIELLKAEGRKNP